MISYRNFSEFVAHLSQPPTISFSEPVRALQRDFEDLQIEIIDLLGTPEFEGQSQRLRTTIGLLNLKIRDALQATEASSPLLMHKITDLRSLSKLSRELRSVKGDLDHYPTIVQHLGMQGVRRILESRIDMALQRAEDGDSSDDEDYSSDEEDPPFKASAKAGPLAEADLPLAVPEPPLPLPELQLALVDAPQEELHKDDQQAVPPSKPAVDFIDPNVNPFGDEEPDAFGPVQVAPQRKPSFDLDNPDFNPFADVEPAAPAPVQVAPKRKPSFDLYDPNFDPFADDLLDAAAAAPESLPVPNREAVESEDSFAVNPFASDVSLPVDEPLAAPVEDPEAIVVSQLLDELVASVILAPVEESVASDVLEEPAALGYPVFSDQPIRFVADEDEQRAKPKDRPSTPLAPPASPAKPQIAQVVSEKLAEISSEIMKLDYRVPGFTEKFNALMRALAEQQQVIGSMTDPKETGTLPAQIAEKIEILSLHNRAALQAYAAIPSTLNQFARELTRLDPQQQNFKQLRDVFSDRLKDQLVLIKALPESPEKKQNLATFGRILDQIEALNKQHVPFSIDFTLRRIRGNIQALKAEDEDFEERCGVIKSQLGTQQMSIQALPKGPDRTALVRAFLAATDALDALMQSHKRGSPPRNGKAVKVSA